MSLPAVQGLRVTVSIYAEKGLLDKSTMVRIRLGRQPTSSTAFSDLPPPSLSQPVPFDEMLEFPSERELASRSTRRPPAHDLRSMLRVSTFVAFALGVAVGASPGKLDLSVPTLLTVTAPPLPAPVPPTGTPPTPAPPQVTRPPRLVDVDDSSVVAGTSLTGVPVGRMMPLLLRSLDEFDQHAVRIDGEHESPEGALDGPRADAEEAVAAGFGPVD